LFPLIILILLVDVFPNVRVRVVPLSCVVAPRAAANASSFVVFPGCYIPSLCFLVETMNRGTQGRLTVDSVANIGPHYARTLREWKRKFLRNWTGTIASALVDQYGLDDVSLEVFKRKWICEFFCCM
jgi:cyclopropane fatty-acyl-phospholipid synthase-like methyltransferase